MVYMAKRVVINKILTSSYYTNSFHVFFKVSKKWRGRPTRELVYHSLT